MSSKKEDIEFRLEVLDLQLKSRRYVTLSSSLMSIGVTMVFFSISTLISIGIAFGQQELETPAPIVNLFNLYGIIGGLLTILSIGLFFAFQRADKRDIRNLKKKYTAQKKNERENRQNL